MCVYLRRVAFAQHLRQRRVPENRQQLAELPARQCRRFSCVARIRNGSIASRRASRCCSKGTLGIAGDEQDARLLGHRPLRWKPSGCFGSHRPADGSGPRARSRLCARPDRRLGELERQMCKLRCRQRETQMDQRRGLAGSTVNAPGSPGTDPRILPMSTPTRAASLADRRHRLSRSAAPLVVARMPRVRRAH